MIMAMAVDSRHQQQPFNNMGYDPMRYHHQPQFTNPWVSAPASTHGQMYATSLPATTMGGSAHGEAHRYAPVSGAPAYTSAPISAPSRASDGMNRQYSSAYAASGAPPSSSYATSAAPSYGYGYSADRRPSHPLSSASEAERQQFSDALDASRGMVAMSQSDITPRPIYGNPTTGSSSSARSSTDSYGFPAHHSQSHSSHSSISSASTYPSYYNSSVSEGSVGGDYSSASESVDMPNSRTLPRPQALLAGGAMPPAPSTMMGQFSSKVSSSSQKKHKCKICDKRFTRPSSLQTHMYSHTGEKPFACDVEGCGRHFSVVSNLRRHRKVHRGEGPDHNSPDDDEE